MMQNNVLEDVILEIRDAEKKADDMVRAEKERAKQSIDAAEAECAKMVAQCSEETKQTVKQALAEADKAAADSMAEKTKTALDSGRAALAAPRARINEAMALIAKRITAKYGDS